MQTNNHPEATKKRAQIVGGLFIATFVTAIAALVLYGPVLNDADYVLSGGADTRVQIGAFLEVLLVIANIGTAVVLWPVLKRVRESMAIGYVASRIVESTIIAIGIVSVLSVLTLQQEATSTDSSLVIAGQSLVAIHDWTFLLGPAFCAGFGNGILLGYMMFRSGLVPRRLATWGIVGGPLAFLSATLVLFGVYEQTSGVSFLMTFPEMVWEAGLGIYLLVRGFKTTSAIRESAPSRPVAKLQAA